MKTYLLVALILGVVLMLVYIVRERSNAKLDSGSFAFLSGVSVVVGGRLIYVTITAHELKPFSEEERIYIVLGGIALIWVSVQTILGLLGFTKAKRQGSN